MLRRPATALSLTPDDLTSFDHRRANRLAAATSRRHADAQREREERMARAVAEVKRREERITGMRGGFGGKGLARGGGRMARGDSEEVEEEEIEEEDEDQDDEDMDGVDAAADTRFMSPTAPVSASASAQGITGSREGDGGAQRSFGFATPTSSAVAEGDTSEPVARAGNVRERRRAAAVAAAAAATLGRTGDGRVTPVPGPGQLARERAAARRERITGRVAQADGPEMPQVAPAPVRGGSRR